MPPIASPHSIFPGPELETPRPAASQSRYCYLFPDLAREDRAGCFAGTTPAQTFARLEAFEESSRVALSGLPVLPMRLPAVYTYFGQFVNHDISAPVGDVVTRARPEGVGVLGTTDPAGLDRSRRSTMSVILKNFFNEQPNPLSLDSLYGDGPDSADPAIAELYDDDRKRFRLGVTRPEDDQVFTDAGIDLDRVLHATGARDILRRKRQPLIADRRNDENLIISQLHLALMLFHNKMVTALEAGVPGHPDSFAEARRLVTLHYHWLILNDFLQNLLSPRVLQTPLAERPQKLPAPGTVPLEFTTSAFRFGHSMVGAGYDFNANFGRGGRISRRATLRQLFTFTSHRNMGHAEGKTRALPDHWVIDWDRMSRPRKAGGAEQIDLNFANDMLNAMGASDIAVHGSILFRNLVRGFHRRMPFGQVLADACGHVPLSEDDIRAVLPAGTDQQPGSRALREFAIDFGFLAETPAWLYFLAEARHHEQGERVGPTASAIIADTIVGLLRHLGSPVLVPGAGGWHPSQSPLKGAGGRALTSIRGLLLFAVKDTAV